MQYTKQVRHQHTTHTTSQTEGNGVAAAGGVPPTVLRGANNHTVGIDWIRIVADCYETEVILQHLTERFGISLECPGLHRLTYGETWLGGLRFSYDDQPEDLGGAGYCTIEAPGEFLQGLDFKERIEFLRLLLTKFETTRCTRIDVALDWQGEGISLIDELAAAAGRGELSVAKTHGRHQELSDGQLVNDGFTVGKRGKNGSGRYLRVYDKGLEQRQPDDIPIAGRWIRWEVEFSKAKGKGRLGLAHQVAEDIVGSEDPAEVARGHALGAVEFRVANGLRKRDRPLCVWWVEFVGSTSPRRCTVRRAMPSFASWAGWMKRCVLPRVQTYAAVLGITPQQFAERYIGKVLPRADLLSAGPGFWQFSRSMLD